MHVIKPGGLQDINSQFWLFLSCIWLIFSELCDSSYKVHFWGCVFCHAVATLYYAILREPDLKKKIFLFLGGNKLPYMHCSKVPLISLYIKVFATVCY